MHQDITSCSDCKWWIEDTNGFCVFHCVHDPKPCSLYEKKTTYHPLISNKNINNKKKDYYHLIKNKIQDK